MEADSVAEDMIADTESFLHVEIRPSRGRTCVVGDETGYAPSVQLNNETSNFFTEFLELDQGVSPRYK